MTAQIIAFPLHRARPVTRKDCEAAWDAYSAHRAAEIDDPGLADDHDHKREANRLYAMFIRACEAMEFGAPRQNGGDSAA